MCLDGSFHFIRDCPTVREVQRLKGITPRPRTSEMPPFAECPGVGNERRTMDAAAISDAWRESSELDHRRVCSSGSNGCSVLYSSAVDGESRSVALGPVMENGSWYNGGIGGCTLGNASALEMENSFFRASYGCAVSVFSLFHMWVACLLCFRWLCRLRDSRCTGLSRSAAFLAFLMIFTLFAVASSSAVQSAVVANNLSGDSKRTAVGPTTWSYDVVHADDANDNEMVGPTTWSYDVVHANDATDSFTQDSKGVVDPGRLSVRMDMNLGQLSAGLSFMQEGDSRHNKVLVDCSRPTLDVGEYVEHIKLTRLYMYGECTCVLHWCFVISFSVSLLRVQRHDELSHGFRLVSYARYGFGLLPLGSRPRSSFLTSYRSQPVIFSASTSSSSYSIYSIGVVTASVVS